MSLAFEFLKNEVAMIIEVSRANIYGMRETYILLVTT